MYSISAHEAFQSVMRQKDRNYHHPGQSDPRFRDGGLFPHLYPKFQLTREDRIFTMGSCFARHIEDALHQHRFQLPVRAFTLPDGEMPYPAPHLLNEYNAGTISQRLGVLTGTFRFADESGIEDTSDGAIDLFLHVASRPVSRERLMSRRGEIDALYAQLPDCDCLVLTLGLVEAWYDLAFGCYLNRAPSFRTTRREPGRFQFRRFDVADVVDQLRPAIHSLLDGRLSKVLLTVSPVPMEVSFMPGDIVVNNAYSKSTLRAACEILSRNEPCIDYYPSYEIVTSFGAEQGFSEDGVHPKMEVVERVISHLAQHYLPHRLLTTKDLDRIYESWSRHGVKVLLYPAGGQAMDMLAQTPGLQGCLVAFGDRDPGKQASTLLGRPVWPPADISHGKVDLVLLASSQFEDDLYEDLQFLAQDGIRILRPRDLHQYLDDPEAVIEPPPAPGQNRSPHGRIPTLRPV